MSEELENLRTMGMCPRISTIAVRSYYAATSLHDESIGAACIDAWTRLRNHGVLMIETIVFDPRLPIGIAVEA